MLHEIAANVYAQHVPVVGHVPFQPSSQSMLPLYPLRFEPILRRYIWGGRRLASVLNKEIGTETCAESWEIVDHGANQSVVVEGPLKGRTLNSLVHEYGEALTGQPGQQNSFPLLLKFLDADKCLSVQVHPSDADAAKVVPAELGKTEAWIVLAAEPESIIYAGLRPGVDRVVLERALRDGSCEECLHSFKPKVGDCILLPAGTVHALGRGLLVAEIQQSSDTTYRLFDWNRVGPDGKHRELHVEQALDVINWQSGPISPQAATRTDRPHVTRLVSCDKFVLDRWDLNRSEQIGGDGRFHLIMMLKGKADLTSDAIGQALCAGQTALVPAGLQSARITPQPSAELLDIYLPE